MANEINAVAGQLWGIPMGEVYTAGPGIKIDNVHKIVSVDETVLWSGNENVVLNNFITLNELASNFSLIRVDFGASTDEWVVSQQFPGSTSRWGVTKVYSDNSSSCALDITELKVDSNNALKWIFQYPRRITFNSNSTMTFTNNAGTFYIKKIVGIHRIAGGN